MTMILAEPADRDWVTSTIQGYGIIGDGGDQACLFAETKFLGNACSVVTKGVEVQLPRFSIKKTPGRIIR
jgi:hypothetical protein